MNEELDERISVDPKICHGKPCIKGTRIPVQQILELLEGGEKIKGVLKIYPHITKPDILACIRYARKLVEAVA
ncbi:MAG: DUF433 domain-containing protein [Candidatus Lokiarchaeota archaeon]|nr:DUF433 domain-containing protein [Candidatus Lokiarchaeota archaeon]